MNFTIVTTFKDEAKSIEGIDLSTLKPKAMRHWIKNGSQTISFGMRLCQQAEQYLPDNAKMLVYYEGKNLPESTSKVTFVPHVIDKVEKFKSISKNRFIPKQFKKYDYVADSKKINRLDYYYEWDAVRFCHPPFALIDSLDKIETRYLISIDSDVQIHKPIPIDFFPSLVREGVYVHYLSRHPVKHMESGFIIWDTQHPSHKIWWDKYRELYEQGKIYELFDGWTDCHAFDYINTKVKTKTHHIARANHNQVWGESPLREYMAHYKGVAV